MDDIKLLTRVLTLLIVLLLAISAIAAILLHAPSRATRPDFWSSQTAASPASPDSITLDIRRGCESPCVREYLRRLDSSVSRHARINAERALCDLTRPRLAPGAWTSTHPLVIGASQGSSATRSSAAMTAALGFPALHHDLVVRIADDLSLQMMPPAGEVAELSGALMGARDREGCSSLAAGMNLSALEAVDAVFDSPFPEFINELLVAFPNAFVFLAVRDPDAWLRSRRTHHMSHMPYIQPCGDLVRDASDETATAAYTATNDFVRCAIPATRLLEFNVDKDSEKEIWAMLLAFMNNIGPLGRHAVEVLQKCSLPTGFKLSCANLS